MHQAVRTNETDGSLWRDIWKYENQASYDSETGTGNKCIKVWPQEDHRIPKIGQFSSMYKTGSTSLRKIW